MSNEERPAAKRSRKLHESLHTAQHELAALVSVKGTRVSAGCGLRVGA